MQGFNRIRIPDLGLEEVSLLVLRSLALLITSANIISSIFLYLGLMESYISELLTKIRIQNEKSATTNYNYFLS